MSSTRPKVVIIGGGATGTGVARAAAEWGMEVILVERGSLGSGTSSRFHGILHSGARYAVADPGVAAECYQENTILRAQVAAAITDTGGLFVALNDKEAAHADTVQESLRNIGIPFKELSTKTVLSGEPNLNPSLRRAFTVPDGFIDSAILLRLNQQAAEQAEVPARFLTNHSVTGFRRSGHSITAVLVRQAGSALVQEIECDYVINAAGVWAGEVADLASVQLAMIFDKGTMIVFNQQFTSAVINRCRPEDDGDLLVPHAGQSIMGTTSRIISNPDDSYPTQEEVDVLLREGIELVPALSNAEGQRIYAGVRPLQDEGDSRADSRSLSRSFKVLDHQDQGIENFISVVGGKVTLYRLMAEATIEKLRHKIG